MYTNLCLFPKEFGTATARVCAFGAYSYNRLLLGYCTVISVFFLIVDVVIFINEFILYLCSNN